MSQHKKNEMYVRKRNGSSEPILFDKILNRIKKQGNDANLDLNYSSLTMKVIDQLYDGISTSKIDELTCEQCASLSTQHPDYGILASRIFVSNHHKNTKSSFFEAMTELWESKNEQGIHSPILSVEIWNVILYYQTELTRMIVDDRDYLFDYFGLKTLERAYLFKVNNKIVERPQHMWLRVSVGIHGYDLNSVKETYDLMSLKYFTHATPTLFNSGTKNPQLSSCYLLGMEDDSLDGIFNTLHDCANISKYAGGIGLHIHNIRCKNSLIKGTNGTSNGIVPMLKVFNDTSRFINQSGKRNGSFAIYLEPWHPEIEDFLELKKNHGDEDMRARDLFYALWIPDLFMKKVKNNEPWCFFCPNKCPGLSDVYDDKFEELYDYYESNPDMIHKKINARDLWFKILDSQMETGTPYILYKDAANKKSNQKNLGTIKSSNLCTEIIEYSDDRESAVCNLASIALPSFIEDGIFNYEKLHEVTKVITTNLNKIIDINFYPTPKTKRSNLLHRPIGIGVQGLADMFVLMNIPYHSEQAKQMNKYIFETIYHAALEKSWELSVEHRDNIIFIKEEIPREIYESLTEGLTDKDMDDYLSKYMNNTEIAVLNPILGEFLKDDCYCGAYSSFRGSPASEGILQFDMWNVNPTNDRYNWDNLKEKIKADGIRNSLLLAPMPTASTSQILGFNECFEPFTSNIYSRRTLAGEFILPNKYLIRELLDLEIWNEDLKNNIILNKGSIQHLEIIPKEIREKYKIVWEMPMKHLIDMSADRGAFICQSKSLNLWL